MSVWSTAKRTWRYAFGVWVVIALSLLALDTPIDGALGASAIAVGMAFGMHLLLEKIDEQIRRR